MDDFVYSDEKMREHLRQIPIELDGHIKELESKIKQYGSFNLIADSMLRNQLRLADHYADYVPGAQITAPEYLTLICLKFPYCPGYKEMFDAKNVTQEFSDINDLVGKIIGKYTFVHYSKFHRQGEAPSEIEQIAQLFSGHELLVRNPTFEAFHWDLIEGLYNKYEDDFKKTLGFTALEAIRLCQTIADYISEGFEESLNRLQKNATEMYEEIMRFKYKNKRPNVPFPEEHLQAYLQMPDRDIRMQFFESMIAYEMNMIGDTISFTAKDISEMEGIDIETVSRFLQSLSLSFGEINPDFSRPEIMHPLKDKPLIHHQERYICPSMSLLDYSLDRLFSKTLLLDPKKREKYKLWRHEYLLAEGMKIISTTLNTTEWYTNLKYPNGEMDGIVFCGSNIFFIEAKGHLITDRAKKGYIDRIESHIEEIIKGSYSQAIRTYNYLSGKKDVEFTDKAERKVILDGSKYQNAYFISLTLEDMRSISCSLKVNNSLGLFDKETFPWIVSLYDLRVVSEHMEGPAYFIQYLHRRKEFFQYSKFFVDDELDLLAYYLVRNLRFDDLIEEHYERATNLHLDSYSDHFNRYYNYVHGVTRKPVAKLKHYTIQPIKTLVKVLEDSSFQFGVDAAVQLLELSSDTKKELIENIARIRKQFRKDTKNHDLRIGGTDMNGESWMFSYWVGPDEPVFRDYFQSWVHSKFKEEPCNRYIAILDSGKADYYIRDVILLQS